MKKLSQVCLVLVAMLLFLADLAVVKADDGSLELHEQAIYDDGHKEDATQPNYGVKTLFSPEMESQNKKQRHQATAPVTKAQKRVFTYHEKKAVQIQKKNQKLVQKYLFTKRSKLKGVPGANKAPETPLFDLNYLWLTLLFCLMAGLGSGLGIYFTKQRVKRKESRSRWTNN